MQRKFLLRSQQNLSWTKRQTADFIGVHTRTLNDWENEKLLMSFEAAKTLSRKSRIRLPNNIEIRDQYWYVTKGARKGGFASIKKQGGRIGDLETQRQAWRTWWESKGRFENNIIFRRKYVHLPGASIKLAEFIGIMMGDGGLSERQAIITLHHINDLEYSTFVADLMEGLFKVRPRIYHSAKNSVNDIVLSRSELVDHLHSLGLPLGNKVKQQFDIPEWIRQNKKFLIACVRGLVDTDGCIFTHSYKVKGKWYHYKKLSFTSYSEPLRFSVARTLSDLGMSPRVTGKDVRLDSIADMKRYLSIVGSHNPKHLERYAK